MSRNVLRDWAMRCKRDGPRGAALLQERVAPSDALRQAVETVT